jgi:hypothetical protein
VNTSEQRLSVEEVMVAAAEAVFLLHRSYVEQNYVDSELPFAHCIVINGPQASWSRATSETVRAEDNTRVVIYRMEC